MTTFKRVSEKHGKQSWLISQQLDESPFFSDDDEQALAVVQDTVYIGWLGLASGVLHLFLSSLDMLVDCSHRHAC